MSSLAAGSAGFATVGRTRGQVLKEIERLVKYATLAPSGHNAQPWLFTTDGRAVDLRADRTRALPVVDPDDRELLISCGAALETLVLAVRHFGGSGTAQLAPEPDDRDLLARVVLAPGDPCGETDHELFVAIEGRRSYREPFDDREVSVALADRLVAEADAQDVWLQLVGGDDRGAVADLVAEGDRIQMADKRFRRELAAWVHPNHSLSNDGMRGFGFGAGDLASLAGPLVIRSFDLGRGQAAKDRELARHSPLLAILGTTTDEPADWVRTGRALQRLLLRAHAHSVWSSHLNQAIEVEVLRPRLAATLGRPASFPQIMVRLGYAAGPAPKAQPRRPVSEVLSKDQIPDGHAPD